MEPAPKKKIILVEDEPDICLALASRLARIGFDVTAFHDGIEGLEAIRRTHPDLVILDLGLPRLPGEEVCRAIKKDPALQATPVIMLTGKTEDSDRVVGRVIGADAYVNKPCAFETLLQTIKDVFARHKDHA